MKIQRPTLLLDKEKCLDNIRSIAKKAKASNVKWRPHFKTHQSHEVGRWFRNEGIDSCTVSSIKMADYFADDGWRDITVAFPINVLESDLIHKLSAGINLNLLVVSKEGVSALAGILKNKVGIFIEIDPGYHRTGVDPTDTKTIDGILKEIEASDKLTFKGFLSHAGHSYKSRSAAEVLVVHEVDKKNMRELSKRYKNQYPDLVLSIGDTPSISVSNNFEGINEFRPGNSVFYDTMQVQIGACSFQNVAVAMACPVVALYPERNEIVVHGGGVHFSKDFLKNSDGSMNFGDVVLLNSKGWSVPPTGMYLKSLSQEHGIVHAPTEFFTKIKAGDCVGVLPVHSCLTADSMGAYYTLEGDHIQMMKK